MKTAELLEENVGGYGGQANLYRLSEPLNGCDHVVAWLSAGSGPHQPPEVRVMASNPFGAALHAGRLPGTQALQHEVSFNDAVTWALACAGGYVPTFVVAEPDPQDSAAAGADMVDVADVVRVMRVYELALKLGVPSADVLKALNDNGIGERVADSEITPEEQSLARNAIGVEDGGK